MTFSLRSLTHISYNYTYRYLSAVTMDAMNKSLVLQPSAGFGRNDELKESSNFRARR